MTGARIGMVVLGALALTGCAGSDEVTREYSAAGQKFFRTSNAAGAQAARDYREQDAQYRSEVLGLDAPEGFSDVPRRLVAIDERQQMLARELDALLRSTAGDDAPTQASAEYDATNLTGKLVDVARSGRALRLRTQREASRLGPGGRAFARELRAITLRARRKAAATNDRTVLDYEDALREFAAAEPPEDAKPAHDAFVAAYRRDGVAQRGLTEALVRQDRAAAVRYIRDQVRAVYSARRAQTSLNSELGLE